MGKRGFEPLSFSLSGSCSDQLSYLPVRVFVVGRRPDLPALTAFRRFQPEPHSHSAALADGDEVDPERFGAVDREAVDRTDVSRARPVACSGPVDQLGRGQRNAEVSSPAPGEGRYGFSRPAAAPAARIPWRRAAVPPRTVQAATRFRGGACILGRFTLQGGRRRIRISRPRDPHPLSRRGPPPGDFISHLRKAGDLNAAGLTAHRLAGEPGTPVRFTFRTARGTRTRTSCGLNAVTPT